MTDTTPRPSAARTTVCPEEGCRALIPATDEDRTEHRRGHAHERKVREALRRDVAHARHEVTRLTKLVEALDKKFDELEIPEPVAPLEFVEWPEDELEPLDDDEPAQTSQYVNDLDRDDDLTQYDDDEDDEPTQPTYPGASLYTPGPTPA